MTSAKAKTKLSFSRANQYGDCGHKYKLLRVDKVPEIPSLALIGGSAFHDWAHDWELYRLGLADKPEPFDWWFERGLQAAELESGLDRRFFKASGRKSVAHPDKEDIGVWAAELGPDMCAKFEAYDWGDWKVALTLPGDQPIGLEYHVEVDGFQGYVDRIDVDKYGNLRVVDYKAGLRVYPSIQLELYMVALQKMNVRAVYGGYYNARKGELNFEPVQWNHIAFDEYLDMTRRGIDSQFYLPVPGEHCGWCSVAGHCQFRA